MSRPIDIANTDLKSRRIFLMLGCALLAGCAGKTLVDDNPVFTEAPPRRSLTNQSTIADAAEKKPPSVVQTVSQESSDAPILTGNSVVAEVNGTPIFVDDLIGSVRLAVEADTKLSPDEKQAILRSQLRPRLANYVDQEIVLQALRQAIPKDKQDLIADSLEKPFQDVIDNIKSDQNVTTDAELNDVLADQGLSIDLLRESFVRIQMVQGYLSTITEVPETVDRVEIVEYYKEHRDDFTSDERVRCQEIVVRFNAHGGRAGAEERMAEVVRELQQKGDFAQLAVKYSDALSAEKRGDLGWIQRGSLADKATEEILFELKPGTTTEIFTREDRVEIFRVVDHEVARTAPLQEVQQEIEGRIRQQRRETARETALDDLRARATIVTMFDDEEASS